MIIIEQSVLIAKKLAKNIVDINITNPFANMMKTQIHVVMFKPPNIAKPKD